MNTINQNIIKALAESQSPYSSEFKKYTKDLEEQLKDLDLKNKKDFDELMSIMIDFAEDYITDAADEVYKDYTFIARDDSDYDREYGYGKRVNIELDSEHINTRAVKELSKDIIKSFIEWINDKQYKDIISPSSIAKVEEVQNELSKKFPDYLEDFFKEEYINDYIDNLDPDDSRINYR